MNTNDLLTSIGTKGPEIDKYLESLSAKLLPLLALSEATNQSHAPRGGTALTQRAKTSWEDRATEHRIKFAVSKMTLTDKIRAGGDWVVRGRIYNQIQKNKQVTQGPPPKKPTK